MRWLRAALARLRTACVARAYPEFEHCGRARHGVDAMTPRRDRWRQILLSAAGCACAIVAGISVSAWQRADSWWYDQQMRALRSLNADAAEDGIVIVGIDELSLAEVPRPLGQWQPELARMVEIAAAAGAHAVVLDVVLPDRSDDPVAANLDLPLLAAIARASEIDAKTGRPWLPVVLARSIVDDRGRWRLRPLPPSFQVVEGAVHNGLALLRLDDDGGARELVTREAGAHSLAVATWHAATVAMDDASPYDGDPPGTRRLIDFSLGPAIPILSWRDVRRWPAPAARVQLAGRIVFVGAVLPFEDRVRAPLDPTGVQRGTGVRVPGVAVHAQATRNLLAGRVLLAARPWTVWALIAAVALLAFVSGRHRTPHLWIAAAAIVAALLVTSMLLLMMGNWWLPVAGAIVTTLFAAAAAVTREAAVGWRERARLRKTFGGYVSPAVVERLIAGQITEQPQSVAQCAFLFADIRDFTTWSEALGAARTLELLNRYYTQVTAVIHDAGGTVDSFRGDGVMAFFGAPQPLADPVGAALRAALGMHACLARLNGEFARDGLPTVAIGTGLASGPAVVGHVGSRDRYHYTAIGRAVNLAARLEALCKPLETTLVASQEFTQVEPPPGRRWVDLGTQDVKGFGPTAVFSLSPLGG